MEAQEKKNVDRKKWLFKLAGKEYTLELEHEPISGKCFIFLNQQLIMIHVKDEGDRDLLLRLGEHQVGIHLRFDEEDFSYEYDCSIDQRLLYSGRRIPLFDETPSEGGLRQWRIQLPDGFHTVTLEHRSFSQKRIIRVDGEVVVKTGSVLDEDIFETKGEVDETFMIHGRPCAVHIQQVQGEDGAAYRYDLSVDGISVLTRKQVALPTSARMPLSLLRGNEKSWSIHSSEGHHKVTVRGKWSSFQVEVDGQPLGKKARLSEPGILYWPLEIQGEFYAVMIYRGLMEYHLDLVESDISLMTGQKVLPFAAQKLDGRRIWKFELDSRIHTLELKHHQWTGKCSVFLDGHFYAAKRAKILGDKLLDWSFEWQGHHYNIKVTFDLINDTYHYHLSIDGCLIESRDSVVEAEEKSNNKKWWSERIANAVFIYLFVVGIRLVLKYVIPIEEFGFTVWTDAVWDFFIFPAGLAFTYFLFSIKWGKWVFALFAVTVGILFLLLAL